MALSRSGPSGQVEPFSPASLLSAGYPGQGLKSASELPYTTKVLIQIRGIPPERTYNGSKVPHSGEALTTEQG